jgi:hypothetical protein
VSMKRRNHNTPATSGARCWRSEASANRRLSVTGRSEAPAEMLSPCSRDVHVPQSDISSKRGTDSSSPGRGRICATKRA